MLELGLWALKGNPQARLAEMKQEPNGRLSGTIEGSRLYRVCLLPPSIGKSPIIVPIPIWGLDIIIKRDENLHLWDGLSVEGNSSKPLVLFIPSRIERHVLTLNNLTLIICVFLIQN